MSPRHLGPTYCYYVVFLAYVVITKTDTDSFTGLWCVLMLLTLFAPLTLMVDSFPEIMMMSIRPAAEQAELPSDIGKVEVLCFRETKFLVSLC